MVVYYNQDSERRALDLDYWKGSAARPFGFITRTLALFTKLYYRNQIR